jgi:hypothetical protein
MKRIFGIFIFILGFIMSLAHLTHVWAQGTSGDAATAELARKTQNPVSDLISLPFQYNLGFNYGPYNRAQHVLNIQPVVPFKLTGDWNLITRTILPVLNQPKPREDDSRFGIGDLNTTLFLSPGKPGKVIWEVGPIFSFPTATDEILGTEKWSAGLSGVVLTMPGRWVIGALANNLWSYAGASDRGSVNQFLFQYFINYNFDEGWYFTSSPILTANWKADKDDKWTIPVGGGFGKIFRIGKLPMNGSLAAFYNIVRPDSGPEYSLRFQLQFLFPR